LDEIGSRIAEDNPPAAMRVVAAIVHGIEQLRDAPGRGRPGRIRGTRELVIFDTPYLVAYRVHAGDIEILTIQHGARLWPDTL
jgi:plasmid stabilization system protein ParE